MTGPDVQLISSITPRLGIVDIRYGSRLEDRNKFVAAAIKRSYCSCPIVLLADNYLTFELLTTQSHEQIDQTLVPAGPYQTFKKAVELAPNPLPIGKTCLVSFSYSGLAPPFFLFILSIEEAGIVRCLHVLAFLNLQWHTLAPRMGVMPQLMDRDNSADSAQVERACAAVRTNSSPILIVTAR